jgi:hypothetical protein
LKDLLLSFGEFLVEGDAPLLSVRHSKAREVIEGQELRFGVYAVVDDMLRRSESENRPLYLSSISGALADRFPGAKPIHSRLGFRTLKDLVVSFGEFVAEGDDPRLTVTPRGQPPVGDGEELRLGVHTAIGDMIDRSICEKRPLYLPAVGIALAEAFWT